MTLYMYYLHQAGYPRLLCSQRDLVITGANVHMKDIIQNAGNLSEDTDMNVFWRVDHVQKWYLKYWNIPTYDFNYDTYLWAYTAVNV